MRTSEQRHKRCFSLKNPSDQEFVPPTRVSVSSCGTPAPGPLRSQRRRADESPGPPSGLTQDFGFPGGGSQPGPSLHVTRGGSRRQDLGQGLLSLGVCVTLDPLRYSHDG